jgi:hypothetical protein
MIKDSSPVQTFPHLRFSAVVRVARSRSDCGACLVFDRLPAGGERVANDGISVSVLRLRCKIGSLQERAWPRQCVELTQVAGLRRQSEFEAAYRNWVRVGESFPPLQHTPGP